MDIDLTGCTNDFTTIADFWAPDEDYIDLSHEGDEYKVFADLVDDIALATGQYVHI